MFVDLWFCVSNDIIHLLVWRTVYVLTLLIFRFLFTPFRNTKMALSWAHCAESSTYWQFFYYRPPGKFRWISVNHFEKHREISLKCDAKNISLYIYVCVYIYTYIYINIYIYITLDNRFLKILVVIGHVCIYWSKVAEGFSVFNAVLFTLQ